MRDSSTEMRNSRVRIGGWKGPTAGAKESGKEGGAKKRGNESTEEAFPPSFYDCLCVCGTLKERIFSGEM